MKVEFNKEKILQFANEVTPLPRHLISNGYDEAIECLQKWLPIEAKKFQSGKKCFTWTVPPKWSLNRAVLKSLDGEVLIDSKNCELHCVSYSLPFKGEVSLEELKQHLHHDPVLADAVPFIFKYYDRDWGLCCSKTFYDSLKDEKYIVEIDSSDENGDLVVGEYFIQGKTDQEIVLMGHLCHPGQFNDNASGCIAGMAIMEELQSRQKDLHYSYRLLIVPETIGSVAWLSENMNKVPNMIAGVFLEMLAVKERPVSFQYSYFGDGPLDTIGTLILESHLQNTIYGEYREIVGNDERQFNSPGIRVPMVSFSRANPSFGKRVKHFNEYHTHFDTVENADMDLFFESMDCVWKMISALESDFYVHNKFCGEIFLSGLKPELREYMGQVGWEPLLRFIDDLDGRLKISELALEHGFSFEYVETVVKGLQEADLVELKREGALNE